MSPTIGRSGTVSREEVWLSAWLGVATSSNCTKMAVPTEWADKCLEDFDKRFPAEKADK